MKETGKKSPRQRTTQQKPARQKATGLKTADQKAVGEKSARQKAVGEKPARRNGVGEKPARRKAVGEKSARQKAAGEKSARQKAAGRKAQKAMGSAPNSQVDGLGPSVGQNVRAERQRLGISVRELARRVGVSASFLSQFELGQSQAAVNTLFAIASELNLSLDKLLGATVEPEAEADTGGQTGALSAAEAATFAEYLSFQSGVRWRRLGGTPPDHHVQFLLTEYEPGSDSAPGDSPQRHPGDDYGYILEGTLTVVIEGREQLLTAGQAIFMRGDVPHRLLNRSDALVRAVWCVVG